MIKDYRILAGVLGLTALALGLSILKAMQTEYAGYQKTYYRQLSIADYDIKVNQLNIRTAQGTQIDRCMSCHIGIANPDAADFGLPLKTHPPIVPGLSKDPHDFTRIGCTVCHEGNGRGLSKKDAHGQFKHWTLPLKTGHIIQSSCSKCHLLDKALAGAERLGQGKDLFIAKACWTCHMVAGVSAGTKGPNLSNVGDKFRTDYLRTAITEPTDNIHSSKMPKFDWVDEHDTVEALVVYMKSLRKRSLRSVAQGPVEFELAQRAGADKALGTVVSEEHGQAIFHARDAGNILRGGCVNCHSYTDNTGKLVGHSIAPELTYASRSRGPAFLRKHIVDPAADVIDTIMPKFSDLTNAELDSLLAFLGSMTYDETTRTAGKLYSAHCSSCHGNDMDGQGRINQSNKLLDPLPRDFRHQFVVSYKDRFQESIKKGIPGTTMPPWEKLMTDREIDQLLNYLERVATLDKKPFIRPEISIPKVGAIDQRTQEPIEAPNIDRGHKAFVGHCTGCHGKLASGKGVNAYDLAHPLPRNLINAEFMKQASMTPLRLYRSIKLGVPGTPMPPFDRTLTDQGMLDVIAFLQSLNTDQKETSTQ